ncbi:WD repeat domain-containing protein 83 [Tanacetum coccineum]
MDCCLTNSDAHVVGGSEDGYLFIWDLVDASVVSKFRAHSSVVSLSCSVYRELKKHKNDFLEFRGECKEDNDKKDNPEDFEKMEQWGIRGCSVKVCTCTVSYTCSASTDISSLTEKAACINDDETYEVINYTTTVRNLVKTENEECRM